MPAWLGAYWCLPLLLYPCISTYILRSSRKLFMMSFNLPVILMWSIFAIRIEWMQVWNADNKSMRITALCFPSSLLWFRKCCMYCAAVTVEWPRHGLWWYSGITAFLLKSLSICSLNNCSGYFSRGSKLLMGRNESRFAGFLSFFQSGIILDILNSFGNLPVLKVE